MSIRRVNALLLFIILCGCTNTKDTTPNLVTHSEIELNSARRAAIEFVAQGLRESPSEIDNKYVIREKSEVFEFFSKDLLEGRKSDDLETLSILGGFPKHFIVGIDPESLKVTMCLME